jgi:hypothetical protein
MRLNPKGLSRKSIALYFVGLAVNIGILVTIACGTEPQPTIGIFGPTVVTQNPGLYMAQWEVDPFVSRGRLADGTQVEQGYPFGEFTILLSLDPELLYWAAFVGQPPFDVEITEGVLVVDERYPNNCQMTQERIELHTFDPDAFTGVWTVRYQENVCAHPDAELTGYLEATIEGWRVIAN